MKSEYDPSPAGWRVPSKEELEKLQQNSLWGQNEFGQNGRWFSGVSSYTEDVSQVFFPAAGIRDYSVGSVHNRGYSGSYWSSMPYNSSICHFEFNSGNAYKSYSCRARGFSVRCVKE